MNRKDLAEPPGWDDRKILADIWQDNGGTVPDGLYAIYPALIAVAQYGWEMAVDDMLAGMSEHESSEIQHRVYHILENLRGDAKDLWDES